MSDARLPALIFDCDGVLIDSEYLASRVESELVRELGLTLGVEEAHDLFLGKTVDGVLDAIAARTGKRPSSAWVYNWAFATAHAFLRELKAVDGVGVAVEDAAPPRPSDGRGFAVAARARAAFAAGRRASPASSANTSTSPRWCARPKPAPDIYLLAAEQARRRARGLHRHRRFAGRRGRGAGAGMRVIGYAPGNTFDAMRASGAQVIRSMDELIAAIDA